MKRFLTLALIIGSSAVGFVGCDQKSTTEETVKTTGPNGSDTKKIKVEETKTGDAKEEHPATPSTTEVTKP
jgi:hypothetical protein